MTTFWIALFMVLAQALPQTSGSIQGSVLKASAGPLGAARVELIRVDGTAPQTYAAASAPDGTFTIQNVRPGAYRLAASRTGFLRREFGQRSRTGLGMAINIEAGQTLQNLEIELRPAAAISGRVTDSRGDPVAATEVKAVVPSYRTGQRVLRAVQSTVTNDLGEYRLFGLAAGPYYVSAAPPTDSPVISLIVNPALPMIEGLGGGASPFVAVYYPATTDSRIATPIDVTNGGDFEGVNITIVPLKTHHIRGNVPGGMAQVTLVPGDPGLASQNRQASAAAGPFDFPNVAAGDYTLVARSGDLLGMTPVNMRDDDMDGVTIGLSPTVPAPTKVMFEDRAASDLDPDLESVNMNLLADPPIPGADPDVYGPFPNGFLAFGVLPRTDYRITNLTIRGAGATPSARLRDAYIKSIRMGTRDVLNDGFRVDDPGKIPPIEIVLGIHPGILTGTVVNEKQKPGANARVVLVPDGGRRRWADANRTVTADIAGRYMIGAIAPGDYIVYSWDEVEDGSWMDPDFMKKYEGRGKRVHIDEGRTTTLAITAIQ